MTEILTLLIPALLVLLTAYLLLDRLLKNEEKRRGFELFKSNYAVITPSKSLRKIDACTGANNAK